MKNPLLDNRGLPAFKQIKAEHIEPAIDSILQDNRSAIDRILLESKPYSWSNTLRPLEDLGERLSRIWSPVGHLHGVADSEELRQAYNACLPKLSSYWSELGQRQDLYDAYDSVANSAEYASLDIAAQKSIQNALRDFRLSGVALNDAEKSRYRDIVQQLSTLTTRFEENVLDATQAWHKHISDQGQLSGLPPSALALAKQMAEAKQLDGWLFSLEFPSYMPVISYADNRELREEFYQAFCTRASDQGPHAGQWDNSAVIVEILTLRQELAQLLDFGNYAEYSLATKMARTTDEVLEFLNDLASKTHAAAQQEYQELQHYACEQHGLDQLHPWDISYYSEKLRQEKYQLTQEELRPYFPVPSVLKGMFYVVEQLYGLQITPKSDIETWHPDVQFFQIHDESGQLRGMFYLDLYTRSGKRGGAWMDECLVRKNYQGQLQTPVAYLTCNFTPPVGDQPALLTHNEVTTMFHEFGHGLHHMLTLIDYPSVSGINGVAWDAVELPSQFMENWCWEREALNIISSHYETGETLSDELFGRMQKARNFQSAMQIVRQLEFSLFDFRLHRDFSAAAKTDVQAVLDQVRAEVAAFIPPAYNRFQHGFTHIFSGGYGAGYYSYKWAEVLSADAFSKFEENGIFDRATGNAFLHSVLEQGGSREPMELFIEFRGREPSIDALLRHSGLAA